jgi:4-diphosphocytidyl-2-C-methyl-D-erythritol kinase
VTLIKKSVYLEKSPAKINLFLDVKEKRQDGFHNIETLFQAIDLLDFVTVEITIEFGKSKDLDFSLFIDSNIDEVKDLGPDNLAVKAVEAYFEDLPNQVLAEVAKVSIYIYIDKNIPIQAGLGGASANAAATLRALNRFFQENLDFGYSHSELLDQALKIGSDVPFSLIANEKPRVFAESRGEVFKEKKIKFNYDDFNRLIGVKPSFGVPTAKAYQMLAKLEKSRKKPEIKFFNKFEDVVLDEYPELNDIKNQLLISGCDHALLAGSGSTMLGFLSKTKSVEKIFNEISSKYPDYQVFRAGFIIA